MDDAERLSAKVSDLEEAARKLGLYLDQAVVATLDAPSGDPDEEASPVLFASMSINRVAFSTRVQEPEQDRFDRQLREMELGERDQKVVEAKEQIARNIAAGRDPLDDGDDVA